MSSPSQITLRPARKSDIPAFLNISGASFRDDSHTQLKGLAQDPPISASEYMIQGFQGGFFESFLDRPGASITAATIPNDAPGEETIVGYLVTSSRGMSSTSQIDEEWPSLSTTIENRGPKPHSPNPSSASGTIQDLSDLTNESMKEWQKWFLTPPPGRSETRCYFVVSMSVHPDHQSKGVGSVLLRELTAKCDAVGVPCWVQSSVKAYKFYQRHGFVEVGRLELELDRFCVTEGGSKVVRPVSDGSEQPWGRYVWAYMERPPAMRVGED